MAFPLQSNFHFPFIHRREKRKTAFCSPRYLVLIYIKIIKNLKKGDSLKFEGKIEKKQNTSVGGGGGESKFS